MILPSLIRNVEKLLKLIQKERARYWPIWWEDIWVYWDERFALLLAKNKETRLVRTLYVHVLCMHSVCVCVCVCVCVLWVCTLVFNLKKFLMFLTLYFTFAFLFECSFMFIQTDFKTQWQICLYQMVFL